MNRYCRTWIEDWCHSNGWTDLFTVKKNEYWAFPPQAVMPLPIPSEVLSVIKQQKGLTMDERKWRAMAVGVTAIASILSYFSHSPMPLIAAFGCSALIVGHLDAD
jgi:hypothetical protein